MLCKEGQQRQAYSMMPCLALAQGLPLPIGTILPAAVLAGAVFSGDENLLATTCLAPFLGTLFCQIWMETVFVKRGEAPCAPRTADLGKRTHITITACLSFCAGCNACSGVSKWRLLCSGSPMWPMVPTVHHVYRVWQLSRGGVLVALLKGPAYLQHLQVPITASMCSNCTTGLT